MHLTRAAALSVATTMTMAIATAFGCGTSSHPPTSDPGTAAADGGAPTDAGPAVQPPLLGDASPDDPYYDCIPVDAGGGSCPCKADPYYPEYTLQCGAGVCSELPNASSYCTPDGHLIRLSICLPDAGFSQVPACAPGTHPLPPR
jgi:hypothetical protein